MTLDSPAMDRIEHIVIVMMENRSFDHMLGYLGKSEWRLGDPNDPDSVVDGLRDEEYTVEWEGVHYQTFPLGTTKWEHPRRQDPPHSGKMVGWQVEEHGRPRSSEVKNPLTRLPGALVRSARMADPHTPDHLLLCGGLVRRERKTPSRPQLNGRISFTWASQAPFSLG